MLFVQVLAVSPEMSGSCSRTLQGTSSRAATTRRSRPRRRGSQRSGDYLPVEQPLGSSIQDWNIQLKCQCTVPPSARYLVVVGLLTNTDSSWLVIRTLIYTLNLNVWCIFYSSQKLVPICRCRNSSLFRFWRIFSYKVWEIYKVSQSSVAGKFLKSQFFFIGGRFSMIFSKL